MHEDDGLHAGRHLRTMPAAICLPSRPTQQLLFRALLLLGLRLAADIGVCFAGQQHEIGPIEMARSWLAALRVFAAVGEEGAATRDLLLAVLD